MFLLQRREELAVHRIDVFNVGKDVERLERQNGALFVEQRAPEYCCDDFEIRNVVDFLHTHTLTGQHGRRR